MIEVLPVLNDAMNGLPNERKAAGTIAMFTVIPMAIVGIVAGGFLAPVTDDGALILGLVGGGLLAAAVGLVSVFAVYRLFGFRMVARLAAFHAGAYLGVFAGYLLIVFFDWWGFLLAPLLGLLNAVFRPFARRPKAATPEGPLQPGEWRRNHRD